MPKSILIIDDDQALAMALKDGLEAMGYRASVAFDGLQGILQAHQVQPDLIILDFHMPGSNGGTVYERLRQNKDTLKTPIVFSTVVSMEEVKRCLRPSANTYFLKKPAGLGQIVSVIRSIFGEKPSDVVRRPNAPAPAMPAVSAARAKVAGGLRQIFAYNLRVTYADVDRMGVVYYGNYFRFFEAARTELLRGLGMRYRDLEIHRKLYLPVAEADCRYVSPARYDDLLRISTWISVLGKASLTFAYEVSDAEAAGRKIAVGTTRHAVVNDLWKMTRLPDDLRTALSSYLAANSPEAEAYV